MANLRNLEEALSRIDGRGYKAYKSIQGGYGFRGGFLYVDHVQGDPFAAPSKLRVRFESSFAGIPEELHGTPTRRVALEDFLARRVRAAIHHNSPSQQGSGSSGRITIDAGRQEVLDRTAVKISRQWVEARVEVGLPARGRTVLGRVAAQLLCEDLVRITRDGLTRFNRDGARRFVECVENFEHIQASLASMGMVAFVADGAILPRQTGVSDTPMPREEAVPTQSPESLSVSINLPNPISDGDAPPYRITGMGIPKGVTLITGGGYHGKSTLLRAIEKGVYPHLPGDGREYVVTDPNTVKIRAEDRRRIERVGIHPFIGALPGDRGTEAFRTDEASGSTSQAASIMEALEAGATALLMDEDTSATNFMVRDARMQALIPDWEEPITPFVDRVREMHERLDVSTVLVMGGSGDYLEVSDTVIRLREYRIEDATADAKAVIGKLPTGRRRSDRSALNGIRPRSPEPRSIDPSRGKRSVVIQASSPEAVRFGTETIDLRAVEQLLDPSQARAIGYALHLIAHRSRRSHASLPELLDQLDGLLDRQGLDGLDPFRRGDEHPGNFARPRRHEVAAALNRLRSVTMR